MRTIIESPKPKITGTELLLCIAILSILGALLIPTFEYIRRNNIRIGIITHQNMCAANQKQLGLALIQYSQDYDNCLPNTADVAGSTNSWRKALHPYVKTADLYQCPARPGGVVGNDGYSQNYAANFIGSEGAFAGPGAKPITRADFTDPAHTIALLEASQGSGPDFDIENTTEHRTGAQKLWAGHDEGSNYLLTDGHVQWMRPLETYQTDSGRAVVINYWHRDTKTPLSSAGITRLRAARAN